MYIIKTIGTLFPTQLWFRSVASYIKIYRKYYINRDRCHFIAR